ncbi:MAG: hypothetical protein HQK71_05435 [Desulfamplus sp.]|nr:hypothetical protein [Desulfamplus sp.]
MKAYECYASIMADGQLSIPLKIANKLKTPTKIRVMIFVEDEDTEWNDFTMTQFFNGYSEEDSIYDSL